MDAPNQLEASPVDSTDVDGTVDVTFDGAAAVSDSFVEIDQSQILMPQSVGSVISRQKCKWMQPGDVNEGSLALTSSQLFFDIDEEDMLKKRRTNLSGVSLRQQWTWNLTDIRFCTLY